MTNNENINWEELRAKVKADEQKEIDNETQTVNDILEMYKWTLSPSRDQKSIIHSKERKDNFEKSKNDMGLSLFGSMKPVIEDAFNLWPKSSEEVEDIEYDTENDGSEKFSEEDEDIDLEDEADESNDDCDYGDECGLLPDDDTEVSNEDSDVSNEDIQKYAWNNRENITKPITEEEEKNIEDYLLKLEEPGMHPELDSTNKDDIQCPHLAKDIDMYSDDSVYIYPLMKNCDICLCRQCNMILASKMMEQLVTEAFV